MTERLVASGHVLVGRYELHDQVSDNLGASHWRAHDRVLKRNVGVELLPSDDPRAAQFIAAAKASTAVNDHRFLRVLDLLEDEEGYCVIVREWARATSLDTLLGQAPLPNQRAATIVGEVAEALSNAHALGLFHRRLMPHHVLVKESGAVRIVGLGVADALSPADHALSAADIATYQRLDVEAIGKLLYACLVSRWPGGRVDGLRAAPTVHGKLLRPRQVRAGVSRELDDICDRLLIHSSKLQAPITKAGEAAQELLYAPDESEVTEESPAAVTQASQHDVLRLDPVIEPSGPPPGLEPPRRRPKAFEPAEPTLLERGKERVKKEASGGDRLLILAGLAVVVVIALVLGVLVNLSRHERPGSLHSAAQQTSHVLDISRAYDLDPYGSDHAENPELTPLAIDRSDRTGWYTSTYYRDPRFGRLKPGVGLVLDLGRVRDVARVQLDLVGSPTSLTILTASPGANSPPSSLVGLTIQREVNGAGTRVNVPLPKGTSSRYVVVWLRSLPQIAEGQYRGQINNVVIRGS